MEELLTSLLVKLNERNLKIGVAVDTDLDFTARYWAVTNRLKDFGDRNIPKIPPETGWIYTLAEKSKIRVWVMPNNKLPSMLEDFVKYLIPPDDNLEEKIVWQLDNIEIEDLNLYSLTHRPKALIHSWLVLQQKFDLKIVKLPISSLTG